MRLRRPRHRAGHRITRHRPKRRARERRNLTLVEITMAEQNKQGFDTATIHAGQSPDPTSLSRGLPITRTSSFVFKSAEHAANLFALKEFGNIYTRLTNPTNAVLEDRVTALEGGAASVTAASGTAAIFNTIVTIAKVGDEILSASNLYGGTYTLFDAILPDLGINTKFVDVKDPRGLRECNHFQDPTDLHRDDRQPRPRRGGHSRHLQDRQEAQAPPRRGRHVHHSIPPQLDRARSGHRREFL